MGGSQSPSTAGSGAGGIGDAAGGVSQSSPGSITRFGFGLPSPRGVTAAEVSSGSPHGAFVPVRKGFIKQTTTAPALE